MMNVLMARAALVLATLLAGAVPSAGQSPERTVHVDAELSGVGVLRPRGAGECFVLVPAHVLVDEDGRSRGMPITITGPDALRSAATPEPERFAQDLKILRLSSPAVGVACPPWPDLGEVNVTLRRAYTRGTPAIVVGWTPAGPATPVEAQIGTLQSTYFSIRSARPGELKKGMSGSLVHVDGVPVGIVVEVEDGDDGAEIGSVIRLDHMEGFVHGFFRPTLPPSDWRISLSLGVPGLGQMATGRKLGGALILVAAAGASAGLYFSASVEEVTETDQTPTGDPYEGSRPAVRSRYRTVALVPWFAAGAVSLLEARRFATRRDNRPARRPAASAAPRLQLKPAIDDVPGGAQVQVAELRF